MADKAVIEHINTQIQSIPQVTLTDTQCYYGKQHDALPILLVKSDLCEAVIALQGAHIIEFKALNQAPLLWNSPKSQYKKAKAIRGGVPICFPWFGENQFDKTQSSHGFVRNQFWHLKAVELLSDGVIEIVFSFSSSTETLSQYPYSFTVEYKVRFSTQLEITLTTTNLSKKVMPVSFALHSYHPVSDIKNTTVTGLDWTTYLDNLQHYQAKIQQGDVTFSGEVDRIYLNVAKTQTIQTEHPINLTSQTCQSAIVWNPAFDKADSMSDLGGENYTQFVCVERGIAFANSWYLAPNETKTAELTISNALSNASN